MISDSGSTIPGLSQIKCGLSNVDRPVSHRVSGDRQHNKENPIKTILITGASSGYGLETARHFHTRGWRVIATMRTPGLDILPHCERIRVLGLDVTRPESIAAAIEAAGPIDALVNNAGIGAIGVLETMPVQKMRAIFETNTFGVMAMTQAVIPGFRAQRSGVVVNVTSSAVLTPMPLVSVYTASKAAIEGFTGALAHELAAFGIRAKLVQPGYGPTTRFTQNSGTRIEDAIPESYMAFAAPILTAFATPAMCTTEADVADGVWRAIHDEAGLLSFPAGPDAVALARAR